MEKGGFFLLNLICLSLLVLLLLSCNQNQPKEIKAEKNTKFTFSSFAKNVDLKGVDLNFNQYLTIPTKIFLFDSLLLVVDAKADKFIHVFDIKNKIYLKDIGTKGRGPGEFLSANNIIKSSDNRLFWLYDITLNKLSRFNIDSTLNIDSYVPTNTITFSDRTRSFYSPIWLNDSIIVSPILQGGGRLGFSNRFGTFIKLAGNFPSSKPSNSVPDQIHAEAYQGFIASNRKNKKIVLVTRYASQLETYSFEGNEINKKYGPDKLFPDYEVAEVYSSPVFSLKERKFGYGSIWVNDDNIFTLYSGKSKKEISDAHFSRFVLVYDWNGNPVKCMRLDQPVLGFAVDDKNKIIYAVKHSPQPEIVAYEYENF